MDRVRSKYGRRAKTKRMTQREFEDTLSDLLALPRLDIQKLLPIDGRVAGYDKIAGGLDISPAHLAAYEEAADKAVSAAIANRCVDPCCVSRHSALLCASSRHSS